MHSLIQYSDLRAFLIGTLTITLPICFGMFWRWLKSSVKYLYAQWYCNTPFNQWWCMWLIQFGLKQLNQKSLKHQILDNRLFISLNAPLFERKTPDNDFIN